MLKVAITGNIASGKSTVETSFRTSGYAVLDTDKVCHQLLGCQEVVEAFSSYDIFENGLISNTFNALCFFICIPQNQQLV